MKISEIRKIAKGKKVNSMGMKKTDLIHTIQRAEGNPDCYGTIAVGACGQKKCLWREDCMEESRGLVEPKWRRTVVWQRGRKTERQREVAA